MESSDARIPRGLRILSAALLVWLALFAATAPWRLAGREVGRWSFAAGIAVLGFAVSVAIHRGWRRALAARLRSART